MKKTRKVNRNRKKRGMEIKGYGLKLGREGERRRVWEGGVQDWERERVGERGKGGER